MKMLHVLVRVCLLVVLGVTSRSPGAWTWSTVDYPGSFAGCAYGVSGDNVVGIYTMPASGSSGPTHGYEYNIANGIWVSLDRPGAAYTYASGIDGNNIIGYSGPACSFVYNDGQWTPVRGTTWLYGVSGNNMVGSAGLYEGTTWAYLAYPGSSTTVPQGISGDDIVGYWRDSSNIQHGFLYNNGNWMPLDYPGAQKTIAQGVSGDKVVGMYWDSSGQSHGFLYDGAWTSLDYPGAYRTSAYGISGNRIVGECWLPYGSYDEVKHGFLLTIPEPASLGLLILGCLSPARRRRA